MTALALTLGDPAGIGPDITIAAWRQRAASSVPAFAAIADADVLQARASALGVELPIAVVATFAGAAAVFTDRLPVISDPCPAPVEAGKPDHANAAAVLSSIDRAVAATLAGEATAVVTNPIAKNVLYAAGFRHPGHTEYLGELSRRAVGATNVPAPVMLLASDELNVVPLTIHIPLRAVPDAITGAGIAATVETIVAAMIRDFAMPRPRILVAGLNPHAGESGTIGTEDRDIIAPAVSALAARGIAIRGPVSADTMFHTAARATYDVALTMYHDQGLIPIKTLAFDSGVNVTLGLPFVRTSPDHGTAFEIAGSGRASPSSLIAALKLASRMAANRKTHDGAR